MSWNIPDVDYGHGVNHQHRRHVGADRGCHEINFISQVSVPRKSRLCRAKTVERGIWLHRSAHRQSQMVTRYHVVNPISVRSSSHEHQVMSLSEFQMWPMSYPMGEDDSDEGESDKESLKVQSATSYLSGPGSRARNEARHR